MIVAVHSVFRRGALATFVRAPDGSTRCQFARVMNDIDRRLAASLRRTSCVSLTASARNAGGSLALGVRPRVRCLSSWYETLASTVSDQPQDLPDPAKIGPLPSPEVTAASSTGTTVLIEDLPADCLERSNCHRCAPSFVGSSESKFQLVTYEINICHYARPFREFCE